MALENISQKDKFILILQAAFRFSDFNTLASIKVIGLCISPSSVASTIPISIIPSIHYWINRHIKLKGDILSQAYLSHIYGIGNYVEIDIIKATNAFIHCISSLILMANHGNAEACYRIGTFFDYREPLKTIRSQYSECSLDTTPTIMNNTDDDISVDNNKINEQTQVKNSTFRLPSMFQINKRSKGTLLKDDNHAAMQWYEKASNLGHIDATFRLSIMMWSNRKKGSSIKKKRKYHQVSIRNEKDPPSSSSSSSSSCLNIQAERSMNLLSKACHGGSGLGLLLVVNKQEKHKEEETIPKMGNNILLIKDEVANRLREPSALMMKAEMLKSSNNQDDCNQVSNQSVWKVECLNLALEVLKIYIGNHPKLTFKKDPSIDDSNKQPPAPLYNPNMDCGCILKCNCFKSIPFCKQAKKSCIFLAQLYYEEYTTCLNKNNNIQINPSQYLEKETEIEEEELIGENIKEKDHYERMVKIWLCRSNNSSFLEEEQNIHDFLIKGDCQNNNKNKISNKNMHLKSNNVYKDVKCDGFALTSGMLSKDANINMNNNNNNINNKNKGEEQQEEDKTLSIDDIISIHEKNSGNKLKDISKCGNYFNLLKSNLTSKDISNCFEVFRSTHFNEIGIFNNSLKTKNNINEEEDRRRGVFRLGLSHNSQLGSYGAKEVANEIVSCCFNDYKEVKEEINVIINDSNIEKGNEILDKTLDDDHKSSIQQQQEERGEVSASSSRNPMNMKRQPSISNMHVFTPVSSWLCDLFFNECNIGLGGAQAIAKIIPQCQSLCKLGLNFNNLTDEGAIAILKAIMKSREPNYDCEEEEKLITSMQVSTTSATINEKINEASDKEVIHSVTFKPKPSISKPPSSHSSKLCDGVSILGLIGNDLTDKTAEYAANLLSNTSCPITRLYLNENYIGDDGAVSLATSILHNSLHPASTSTFGNNDQLSSYNHRYRSLERLGLSDNHIGKKGGEHLATALSLGLSSIEKLCASDNPFGSSTFAKLSKLPNVFVGAKTRKGRTNQILDGTNCRVLVIWQPKHI